MNIPKSHWKSMSDEQVDALVEEIFTYYRQKGFPYYPTDDAFRNKELTKLTRYDFTNLIDAKNVKQTMHGLSLAWSFMPHAWEVVSTNFSMTTISSVS